MARQSGSQEGAGKHDINQADMADSERCATCASIHTLTSLERRREERHEHVDLHTGMWFSFIYRRDYAQSECVCASCWLLRVPSKVCASL